MQLYVTKGYNFYFLMFSKYLVTESTMLNLEDTIRVHSTSMKCAFLLIYLLLTFTVKVWCTYLFVEMVFYWDIDKNVDVKDVMLSIVYILYTNIITYCSILKVGSKSCNIRLHRYICYVFGVFFSRRWWSCLHTMGKEKLSRESTSCLFGY